MAVGRVSPVPSLQIPLAVAPVSHPYALAVDDLNMAATVNTLNRLNMSAANWRVVDTVSVKITRCLKCRRKGRAMQSPLKTEPSNTNTAHQRGR